MANGDLWYHVKVTYADESEDYFRYLNEDSYLGLMEYLQVMHPNCIIEMYTTKH